MTSRNNSETNSPTLSEKCKQITENTENIQKNKGKTKLVILNKKYYISDKTNEYLGKFSVKTDTKPYDLYNQKIILSYPDIIDKDDIINFISDKVSGQIPEIESIVVSHEKGVSKDEQTTNVLIHFGKKAFRTKKFDFFKYENKIPTIRVILNKIQWVRANEFMGEIDEENSNLKKNLTLVEQIQQSSSKNEALKNFVNKPGDAMGIGYIYDSKDDKIDIKTKKLDSLFFWQKGVGNLTWSEPDGRTVNWIIGQGGDGKTEIIKQLMSMNPKKYKWISSLGANNLATTIEGWIYDEKWRGNTVLVNLVRSLEDHKIYEGIEMLIDSMVTSRKYKGKAFQFQQIHLIIFANFYPKIYDNGKETITKDRWRIWQLEKVYFKDDKAFKSNKWRQCVEEESPYMLGRDGIKEALWTDTENKEVKQIKIDEGVNIYPYPLSLKKVIELEEEEEEEARLEKLIKNKEEKIKAKARAKKAKAILREKYPDEKFSDDEDDIEYKPKSKVTAIPLQSK